MANKKESTIAFSQVIKLLEENNEEARRITKRQSEFAHGQGIVEGKKQERQAILEMVEGGKRCYSCGQLITDDMESHSTETKIGTLYQCINCASY